MKMQKFILSVTVLATVGIAIFVTLEVFSKHENKEIKPESEVNEVTPEPTSDPEQGIDEGVEKETIPQTAQGGEFVEYSASLLSRAKDNNVVIFFHADWCPTCLALERDINNNLDKIPDNLTIMKADWGYGDTPLAKEYDVDAQHTLILVDETGNDIERWPYGSFLKLEQLVDAVEQI